MSNELQLRLQEEVVHLRADVRELAERCTALEVEVGTLSNLYVASQRLHETLDRGEVLRAIEEILINLVGSEELAIYEVDDGAATLSLLSSFGLPRERFASRRVDDGPIGRAVRTGKTVVVDGAAAAGDEPKLTACVPLCVRDRVIGVIALFQLLPQKSRLEPVDHDLFDLLTTAAATALHNAEKP
ncbi:MAG TPA: GAF domain-containing protein [Polyangia bacterium]|jgi:GAF domain-containing protein